MDKTSKKELEKISSVMNGIYQNIGFHIRTIENSKNGLEFELGVLKQMTEYLNKEIKLK